MLVPRTRFMQNRNTLNPFKYPLLTTIITQSKHFLLTEFYQGVRFKMNTHRVDVILGACRDTDSLQKRMSLSALVPVSNGSSHGLKLILLFFTIIKYCPYLASSHPSTVLDSLDILTPILCKVLL